MESAAASTTKTFEQMMEYKLSKGNNFCLSVILDEIDVDIIISKSRDRYRITLESDVIIVEETCDDLEFQSYYPQLSEIKEILKNIKTYKWNKITGVFDNPESIDNDRDIYKIIDEEIGFDVDKCPVCLERCKEKLKCGHTLCMKCRVKCIKKKNKRCPICRDLNLDITSNEEDEDEE